MRNGFYFWQLVLAVVLLTPLISAAQTTEFTYQGKLVDGALPANANYDFEFRLFATNSGGAAIATQTRLAVPVADGIFTVKLDFGGQFDGNARWLEIAVKPASSPNPLTVLIPRHPLTSSPYSIRSLSSARADVATNSLQLGGVNGNQYVLTSDSRMTDARSPLPNSANYVQNTTAPQSSSNFNISGNGTLGGTLSANAVNAATQYNIGGSRILSIAGTANLFVGVGAGSSTTGGSNSFFGSSAGNNNTTGNGNSFFGTSAGQLNTTGSRNSLFGNGTGLVNATGNDNAFFGYLAGVNNTSSSNSFFGSSAGSQNTNGSNNSFFGAGAGATNTAGDNNSFFGRNAGRDNAAGNGNSFFGNAAGNNTTSAANSFFGNAAGSGNSSGAANAFFGNAAGNTNTTGSNNTVIGANADVSTSNLSFATAIGAGAVVNGSNAIVLGRAVDNVVVRGSLDVTSEIRTNTIIVNTLAGGTGNEVCWNSASHQLSFCASSLRYKTSIESFTGGLNLLNRLRPITFNWINGGTRDVGFAAEEVEKVEPLLVTYNQKGEIEGVKYGQVTTVLVNAVSEQQLQIEQQHRQIEALKKQAEEQKQLYQSEQLQVAEQGELSKRQQAQIDSLKKLICLTHPQADVCKEQ